MFHKNNNKNHNNFEITKKEFLKIQREALIIDVRDHTEFQLLQKIPAAINVPYKTLIANPEKFIPQKTTTVVTVCNAGHRSTAAAQTLREKGYLNSYVLINGIYGYYK